MPWCPRCGTGVSQHEMHEGYKEVKHKSVIIRLPLRERENESILVWTTTPWTLTSNVAAAVNAELDYIKVEQNGHILYLAKELEEKVLKAGGEYKVLEKLKGKDMVGWTYDGPFDELEAQAIAKDQHKVIAWDEVSEADGTGIVHIAPGCGAEDFRLGKEFELEAICPIDEMGVFEKEFAPYSGTHAYEMAPKVISSLKEKDIFYSDENYEHSYPHCWRCSSELLFRLVDEWFIAMDAWRQEIMDVAKQITWIPSYGRELELDWLKNMRDWMISKKRYWGLALPIWKCEDEECDWFDVIGGKEELEERAIRGFDALEGKSPHRPQIDEVKLKCGKCGKDAHRVKDVGNPWLDAGIVPYSTMGYNTDRKHWETWFPAELVLECFPGQFRNWFYALLAMSTMMENKPPFKTLLGHALVRDENGQEMHKSSGNCIWFDEAVEEMGADIMRWIYCSQDPTVNLNFGFGPGKQVRGKFYNTFWQTYAYFCNYARLADYTPAKEPIPFDERPEMDRWILSHMHRMLSLAPQSFEKYEVQRVVRNVEQFVEKLSKWYIRQNRRRFWKSGEEKDSQMAFDTLYRCLYALVRVVAPIMPFTAEEMYQNLVRSHDENAEESVHHTPWPTPTEGWMDEQLVSDMDALRQLTSLGLSARESAGIKVKQPLSEAIIQPANDEERSGASRFSSDLAEILNVKAITILPEGETLPVELTVKPDFKKLGPKLGKQMKSAAAAIKEMDPVAIQEAVNKGDGFEISIDGSKMTIEADEVTIESKTAGDLCMANEYESAVAIKTTLTPELEREGLMRDALRKLQNLRKEVGLEIEDRIDIRFHTQSASLKEMLGEWREHVQKELLCLSWQDEEKADEDWNEISLGKEKALVSIAKSAQGK